MITGSYRRGKSDVGDIDVVFIVDDEMKRQEVLADIVGLWGMNKSKKMPVMLGMWGDYQFDLHVSLRKKMGTMLLHTTGSASFNRWLRGVPIPMGLKLNQYGLFTRSDTPECVFESEDEASVFRKLGLSYVNPEDRSVGCTFPICMNGVKRLVTLHEDRAVYRDFPKNPRIDASAEVVVGAVVFSEKLENRENRGSVGIECGIPI